MTSARLASRLRSVRWIGGASAAGKSSIAQRLASTYGLMNYSCDDVMRDHARRCSPSDTPLLQTFLGIDMDERWVDQPPAVMFESFPWFHGEGFGLIVDDLLAQPDGSPILVEGFRLLPRLVAPLLSRPNQAVWLIATPKFRRGVFEARGETWFPYETRDPARALANLLARDELFAREVLKQTTALHLPLIEVDGAADIAEMTAGVGDRLGLSAR